MAQQEIDAEINAIPSESIEVTKPSTVIVDNLSDVTDSDYWLMDRLESPEKSLQYTEHLGRKCLAVTVSPGDMDEGHGTERAELDETIVERLPFDTDVTYRFGVSVAEDFDVEDDTRFVLAQWKHTRSDDSPPISLRYQSGKLIVTIKSTEQEERFKHAIDLRKEWCDVSVNYKMRLNGTAHVVVIANDEVIADYNGVAGFPAKEQQRRTRFKMGAYRDHKDVPDTVYFSDFSREIHSHSPV